MRVDLHWSVVVALLAVGAAVLGHLGAEVMLSLLAPLIESLWP